MISEPGNGRVLIVDDERLIADTLALILKYHGYEALAAYDGESALTAAPEFDPQALITDVIMPGISGIVLAIRIRERFPECKILLSSGQAATSALMRDAKAEGHVFEILPKPVPPGEIISRLGELMRGRA